MNNSTSLSRRQFLRRSIGGTLALSSLASTFPAHSNGATRTLKLRNLHTAQELKIAYWADGQVLQDNLVSLSHFLRDHRQNETMLMDPDLFHQLWDIQKNLDSDCTFEIISGYRSPKTNAMLRASSDGVAKKSYHTRGRALDIRVIGVPIARVRRQALALEAGGVGYYPSANFVHLDTGPVRSWVS